MNFHQHFHLETLTVTKMTTMLAHVIVSSTLALPLVVVDLTGSQMANPVSSAFPLPVADDALSPVAPHASDNVGLPSLHRTPTLLQK